MGIVRHKKNTPHTPIGTRRVAIIRIVFFILGACIVGRLYTLQVLRANDYALRASAQHAFRQALEPARGIIYVHERMSDAQEDELFPVVKNLPKYLIYAVPQNMDHAEEAANVLAPIVGRPYDDLLAKLSKKNDPYEPLVHGADKETWQLINEKNIKGVHAKIEYAREYTDGPTFGVVSGFVQGYGDERKGQYGIEQQFDAQLDGEWGLSDEEFDAGGNPIPTGTRFQKDAVTGSDIVLTLDHAVQFQACERLDATVKRHRAKGGSVIIMDPYTGALRAACSSPRFDPNEYAKVPDLKNYEHQAITHAWEPGSIFKAITLAIALERGAVTPETTFTDTGSLIIGGETIKNADNKVYGLQTMTGVLAHSINTGAIYAQQAAGKEGFTRMVKEFGFGKPSGIAFPSEAAGNLASLDRKGDIYAATASFGQGITATPLQMAVSFSAIANGGEIVKPYLVEEVRTPDGQSTKTEPQKLRRVISPQTATLIKAMLVTVVEEGHGKRAGVRGYWVAGKTGTAQVAMEGGRGYDPHKTIGSFVGFAPVDHPRFVMLVKIDEPETVTFAESTAAPLFGELAEFLLQYHRIKPERPIDKK